MNTTFTTIDQSEFKRLGPPTDYLLLTDETTYIATADRSRVAVAGPDWDDGQEGPSFYWAGFTRTAPGPYVVSNYDEAGYASNMPDAATALAAAEAFLAE